MTSESGLLTDDDILKEFREHDNTLMEVDEDDDNDDQEVGPQKPIAVVISEAINTSSYSLFNQLMHIIERYTRRPQRQLAIDSFFS